MKLSVVVPCYRSAATLPELGRRLDESLSAIHTAGDIEAWEVVLVVDGSLDATPAVAAELAESRPGFRALILRRNFGQHNALLAGIRAARYEVTVTLDDDLQHPPESISDLLVPMRDQAVDLAYGVPLTEEHGALRSLASRTVKGGLALAGVQNARWVGAFRAFRTDLRDGFRDVNDPHPNLDVLLSWATASVRPVRVAMAKRATGRSGYSLPRLIVHTLNMVTGYGVVPLKVATWLGFVFGLFGLGLLVFVLISYATGRYTVPGFTTTVAVIALFSGAQMVTIGIIGEYLGRQHFRSMHKPIYLVARRFGDDDRDVQE